MTQVLELTATHADGTPQSWEVRGIVEDAAAMVALFPKSVGLKAGHLTRPIDGSYLNGSEQVPYVTARGWLLANNVNGGINETGLRRLRSFLTTAEKVGVEVRYLRWFGNSYETLDAFLAAVSR